MGVQAPANLSLSTKRHGTDGALTTRKLTTLAMIDVKARTVRHENTSNGCRRAPGPTLLCAAASAPPCVSLVLVTFVTSAIASAGALRCSSSYCAQYLSGVSGGFAAFTSFRWRWGGGRTHMWRRISAIVVMIPPTISIVTTPIS
jgi:hypothetical protein